jgi:hypothetical protein
MQVAQAKLAHGHPGSTNRIVVDRGDRLHPRCRRHASSVSYRRPRSETLPGARAAQQQTVTGDGSSDNPFTTACTDEIEVDCATPLFPARSLDGLWDSENVPATGSPPEPAATRSTANPRIGINSRLAD